MCNKWQISNQAGADWIHELELIQNSDFFSMEDAVDDVVALAWETEEYGNHKRMVFRFGMSEQQIKDKLYERDLILEFEIILHF